MEGDYPKFAQTARAMRDPKGKFGKGSPAISDEKTWYEFVRDNNIVEDERVPVGHAYAFSGKWGNPLLEELKERRAAEVAGSHLKWPSLREGTYETERQFQEHMQEWHQDDIIYTETWRWPIHSRWGFIGVPAEHRPTAEWKMSFGIPDLADKRSGERYWPIGRV